VHTSLPPAHTRLRVHWAPGIPRALLFEGRGNFCQSSGATRDEYADACLDATSLRGALATKQSSFLIRGAMDCFASLAMTAFQLK
jgi:hypothetical protein